MGNKCEGVDGECVRSEGKRSDPTYPALLIYFLA